MALPSYQPRTCRNQDPSVHQFHPRRRDQQFCSKQCKNHFHNEERRLSLDAEVSANIKKNDKALQRAHDKIKSQAIHQSFLEYEGFDWKVYSSKQKIPESGTVVLWCYKYGIEQNTAQEKTFIIHKRNS